LTPLLSIYGVIALALLAANAPFISQRLALFGPRPVNKSLGLRLIELILAYFLVGSLGLALEKKLGQIAHQGWEFYAVTGTMFITLAFPGFVYRYLLKHRD
jgi:hypothetical protein